MEGQFVVSTTQAIFGGSWEGIEVCNGAFQVLLEKKDLINKKQCANLYGGIQHVITIVDYLLKYHNHGDLNFSLLLSELFILLSSSYTLVESCGKSNWCEEGVYHANSKEIFRELVGDLKYWYNLAFDMLVEKFPKNFEYKMLPTFNLATLDELEGDIKYLYKRLNNVVIQGGTFLKLSKYLLQRLKVIENIKPKGVDALKSLVEITDIESVEYLVHTSASGSCEKVYKANWLGLPCAIRKISSSNEQDVFEQFNGLLKLSHPNLIPYYFAMEGNYNDVHKSFELTKKNNSTYVGMELMETNLSELLQEEFELSHMFLIDVMLQLARGMCYLHDLHVAHFDLEPQNVLINIVETIALGKNIKHAIVKLIDYGMSRIKSCMNQQIIHENKPHIAIAYMAPEIIRSQFEIIEVCTFKADVYSFAMVCSKILSRNDLFFEELSSNQRLEIVEKGDRPRLPSNCDDLNDLIMDCWSLDCHQRPKFPEICERLNKLKTNLVVTSLKTSTSSFVKFKISSHQNDGKHQIFKKNHVVDKTKKYISKKREVLLEIQEKCRNKVKVLCLVGVGGIGETTLARKIFDDEDVKRIYNASCFIESGGDKYIAACNILTQINLSYEKPRDLKDAQEKLQDFLSKNEVILVLNNVTKQSDIENIVPMSVIFASKGSTLIITTLNAQVLVDCAENVDIINLKEFEEYEQNYKLFVTYSIGNDKLPYDFKEIAKEIVQRCNGLPLCIKVIGAFLRNKMRLRCWEQALEKLEEQRYIDRDETRSNYKIWNILRVSFDNLEIEEKDVFLDICCLFGNDVCPKGMSKERATHLWVDRHKNKFNKEIEAILSTLIYQSLVEVDKDGMIRVHDQLQDMSKDIVKSEENYKNSRMWDLNMADFIQISNKVQGVSYYNTNTHVNPTNIDEIKKASFLSLKFLYCDFGNCSQKIFREILSIFFTLVKNSSNLKCFLLDNSIVWNKKVENNLSITSLQMLLCDEDMWKKLKYLNVLQVRNFSFIDEIPKSLLRIDTLLELDLQGCSNLKKIPDDMKFLTLLKILNLKDCKKLQYLPTLIGKLLVLEQLNLSYCHDLRLLPNEVGNLTSLTILNLEQCRSLTSLPKELGNLKSLSSLNVGGCSSLTSLPNELGNLASLTILNLEQCRSLILLPNELSNLTSLTILNLEQCRSLTSLPNELGNLKSLSTLNIGGCSSLISLPNEMGNLTSLTTLDMWGCIELASLPKELGNLTSLTTLHMQENSILTSLPNELGNLKSLTYLHIKDFSRLIALPNELCNLISLIELNIERCSSLTSLPNTLDNLTSLTTLHVQECLSLILLPNELGNLTSLITLEIIKCSKLTSIPNKLDNLTSLTTLKIGWSSSLLTLPKELGNLTSLTTLEIQSCSMLTTLPNELGNLRSLKTLKIQKCLSLTSLPSELGNLTSLTSLNISDCESLTSLPSELGNLKSLITLKIGNCKNLTSLPQELGNLKSLAILKMGGCSNLLLMPNELSNLMSLTTLDISRCSSFTSLLNKLDNFTSLTILNIRWCTSLTSLPNNLGNLASLTNLDIGWCQNLTSLPNELGNLTSLTTLDISWCKNLTSLPNKLGNLKSLTTLDISNCSSLTLLPNELDNLTSLITLNISNCVNLTSLPNEIGNLVSLTTLNMNGCSSLTLLPNKLGNLISLTIFKIEGCSSLKFLPNELGNFKSLTFLNMKGCTSLISLPNQLGNLTSLKSLDMSFCSSFTSLPRELGNLMYLNILDLSSCSRLPSLPNDLGNLTSLTELYLRCCSSLTLLPKELGNLTSLTYLNVSNCSKLISLPNELGNLISLEELYLGGCSSLMSLPRELGNLSCLTILSLHECSSLKSLPKELGNLTSLEELFLKKCLSLTSLPNELKRLTSLTIHIEENSNLLSMSTESNLVNLSALEPLDT